MRTSGEVAEAENFISIWFRVAPSYDDDDGAAAAVVGGWIRATTATELKLRHGFAFKSPSSLDWHRERVVVNSSVVIANRHVHSQALPPTPKT